MSTTSEKFSAVLNVPIAVLALSMLAFHLISPHYTLVDYLEYNTVHLGFALALTYLVSLKQAETLLNRIIAMVFLGASLAVSTYVYVHCHDMQLHSGFPTRTELVIGIIIMITVVEASRRSFGLVLPVVALSFLSYVFLGRFFSGIFMTSAYTLNYVISRVCTGMQGVLGSFLGISADYIFLFMVFGAIIQVTGAMQFFTQIGRIAAGRLAGGAGMTAVVTSSLMGTVTGSTLANVATTGAFTIPLMKKAGYQPRQAGAIEAAASTGGMFMPPVMGAAAFIMADFTGTPYVKIIQMAAIPALLYYLCLGLYVQLNAMNLGLAPSIESVNIKELLLTAPLFLGPLALLIILLLEGRSLSYSMSLTMGLTVILTWLRKETRPSLGTLVDALIRGVKSGAAIAVTCGLLGLIVASVEMTGLGVKLSSAISALSQGNALLALILTAATALILGFGVTTTVVYVLVAVLIAPALIKMGVPLFSAHFFVLYFGVMCHVTPPVASTCLVASKLAGAKFIPTAFEGVKASLAGFMIPFFCITCPVILLQPQDPADALIGLASTVLTIVAFQVAICNCFLKRLNGIQRMMFAAAGVLLFASTWMKDPYVFLLGIGLLGVGVTWQWRFKSARRDIECA